MLNVLLIDDDEDILDVYGLLLEETGEIKVTKARTPAEGIQATKNRDFDVIVSDYLMSKMNGIELLRLLRSDTSKKVPFILLTGRGDENIVIEALNSGVNYYLKKGDDNVDELVFKIKSAAAKKKSEEMLFQGIRKMQILYSLISHDLRNGLSAIWGLVGLIEEIDDPVARREMFAKLNGLISEYLSMLQEASNYYQVGFNEYSWCRLENIVAEQEKKCQGLVFVNNVPKNLEVFIDSTILHIVMSNLIDNSKRHGQKVSEISFSITKDSESLSLVYQDNGVGVVPNNKQKIFTRGFGKHTGLGLFFSKKLLEAIDMQINETGEFEKGVQFNIRIPSWMCRFKK